MKLKRKKKVECYVKIIILVLIISGVLLGIYLSKNKVEEISYISDGQLDYNVALKKNKYFEQKSLEKDRQYIASLIDYITADFNYTLSVEENIEYKYRYKVIANVNVVDNNTNKVIYKSSEDLIEENIGTNRKLLKINESVKIDYNKYNNLISKFVSGYKLRDVTSTLTVSMCVGVAGVKSDFTKEGNSDIGIDIPLTTDTVGIDMKYNLANNVEGLPTIKVEPGASKVLLYISALLSITDIVLVIMLAIYIKISLTDEEKYKNELKKIVNNYGTYISEVEDEFDMKDYQILKVRKFVDLLEIRDTMHIPIIMIENKESMTACFIIPTDNKILYFYSLGVTQYALPSETSKKTEDKHECNV